MGNPARARLSARLAASALCFILVVCQDSGVATDGRLSVGDYDPKAPDGWPLAVGDRDTEISNVAGVARHFEYWKGNCCINWIDGVPYTAKWRLEESGNIFGWRIYKGHVRAEPTERWLLRNDPVEQLKPPLYEVLRNVVVVGSDSIGIVGSDSIVINGMKEIIINGQKYLRRHGPRFYTLENPFRPHSPSQVK